MNSINEDPFTVPEDFYYLDFFLRQVGDEGDADFVGVVSVLQDLSVSEHIFFDPQHAVEAYQLVLMKLLEDDAASDLLTINKPYYYALANQHTEDTWKAFDEGFSRGFILRKSAVGSVIDDETLTAPGESSWKGPSGKVVCYEFVNGYQLIKRYGRELAKKHIDYFAALNRKK